VSAKKSSSGYEDAAFVKMRDSVSFCKQILFEYVLKETLMGEGEVYIVFDDGLCAGCVVVT